MLSSWKLRWRRPGSSQGKPRASLSLFFNFSFIVDSITDSPVSLPLPTSTRPAPSLWPSPHRCLCPGEGESLGSQGHLQRGAREHGEEGRRPGKASQAVWSAPQSQRGHSESRGRRLSILEALVTVARGVLVGAVDLRQMGVDWGERRNGNFRKEEKGRL